MQASRAQWLYGYEIQHFLCKAFSEEWQCQAATKPSLLSSQNGRQAWCRRHIRGHSVQSFSPRRQDLLSRVSEKTDPRLSCVNHNSSLIPSYKTWTHNSQTDLGLGLRPPVGNLFPSVIRIGAVIVTGRCLTKWNHTFIYFLRTWFNVTFDTFLFFQARMNYGWCDRMSILVSRRFLRFSRNRNSWRLSVKLRRITPWWSRNILISYNSL